MNNYTYFYLSHHSEIKKALFCFDEVSAVTDIVDFVLNSSLKEVAVFTTLEKDQLESLTNKIKDVKFLLLQKSDLTSFVTKDCFVFFIDHLSEELMHQVLNIKPKNIIFDCDFKCEGDYIPIWENCRTFAGNLKFVQAISNTRYKIFEWEKQRDSDIELSVVFPMYNVSKYLTELIGNITAWKAPYIEFLFVDDGSPDNCAGIVSDYSKNDSRVVLLNKENGGCASAREFGLKHSKGKYVCFIDPDDFVDKSMLKKLLFKALSGSYDVSYCGYNEYYNDTKISKPVDDLIYKPYDFGTDDKDAIQFLVAFLRIGIWRMIFKRQMILENNIHFYEDLRRFDDLPFKVETLLHAKSVISVPEHLYYYRLEREGQDVAANDERLFVHFDIFKHLDENFKTVPANKLMDLYHVVKVQTHAWALEKLKIEFKTGYLSKAKEDLLTFYDKKQLKSAVKTYCPDKQKVLRQILNSK